MLGFDVLDVPFGLKVLEHLVVRRLTQIVFRLLELLFDLQPRLLFVEELLLELFLELDLFGLVVEMRSVLEEVPVTHGFICVLLLNVVNRLEILVLYFLS